MSQHSVKFDTAKAHAVYLRDSTPDGYMCRYTGKVDKTCTGIGMSIDHIKARASGGAPQNGKTSPGTNLITASQSANYAKQDKTPKQWEAYCANRQPPAGGVKVDFKEIRKQARSPLDIKRGEQLAALAKDAREARGPNGEETDKSRSIAAKSAEIVKAYHAEKAAKEKAKADKAAGPGIRHDKDGRFMPGNEALAPRQRLVRPGELLAMAPASIRRGADGFFWTASRRIKANDRRGDVALVFVRGELEHHLDPWGCADSYEGVLLKLGMAARGEVEEREGDMVSIVEMGPPRRVLVCIDSPGGVVAGLDDCHAAIVRLVASYPDIEWAVQVNDMAASAAYALACAFPRILCPRSAIIGSVGVISTMISQARKDREDGYDVVLITSGARKADGHLHAPLAADAIQAERERVDKLAANFFDMVSRRRGMKLETVRGMQAAIYLGVDAVAKGLADEVRSLDAALAGGVSPFRTRAGGNETDRRLEAARARDVALMAAVAATLARR